MPLYTENFGVFIRLEEKIERWKVIWIFDLSLWIFFILFIIMVTYLMWKFEKKNKGNIELEFSTGFLNSLNNTFQTFFLANDLKIKRIGGKMIQSIWLISSVVLLFSYCSQFIIEYRTKYYKSFLTNNNLDSKITTLSKLETREVGYFSSQAQILSGYHFKNKLEMNEKTVFLLLPNNQSSGTLPLLSSQQV